MNSCKKYFFIHIPKTGGSSVSKWLDKNFKPENIYDVNTYCEGNERTLDRYNKAYDALFSLSEPQLNNIQLVRGHMPYGAHKLFNCDCFYVTFLREPVDRVVSLYYFILSSPAHYLYETVTQNNLSLSDFAASDISPEIQNMQTRMLCGVKEKNGLRGGAALDRFDYDLAVANLSRENFYVGITSKLKKSIDAISKNIGLSTLDYNPRVNITKKRKALHAISRKEKALIREVNHYDVGLYNIGLKKTKFSTFRFTMVRLLTGRF